MSEVRQFIFFVMLAVTMLTSAWTFGEVLFLRGFVIGLTTPPQTEGED